MSDAPASMSVPPDAADTLAGYFDAHRLVETSRPQMGRGVMLLPSLGLGTLLAALIVMVLNPTGVGVLLGLLLLAASIACTVYLARLAVAAKAERARVRQAEELVTLRHWPQAAGLLTSLLAQPMRLGPNRRAALIALVRTLGRYGLHDDAIDVADAVLEDPGTDPATRFAVGCGRAMLLLQAGRLSDANDALGRLRSEVKQIDTAVRRAARIRAEQAEAGSAGDTAEMPPADEPAPELPDDPFIDEDTSPPPPQADGAKGFDSAALNLVELYRDVQTRHTEESLELFEERATEMRAQLGVRYGDALALAAVAAQRAEREADARRWWMDATCLVPEQELRRRYPELAEVGDRYPSLHRPDAVSGEGGGI